MLRYARVGRFIGFTMLMYIGVVSTAKGQLPQRPVKTDVPQQSVYMELGGNNLIYSLNYDVLFQSNWGFRLGGSYFPFDIGDGSDDNSSAFLGLIMGQRSFGKTAHKLETGAGLLFGTIYDPQQWDFIEPPGATFSIGYRYFPAESSRFTFKAAFTPIITRSGFHPRIGVSFGITLTPEGDASL